MRSLITLLLFLTTHLFPPAVWARMQLNTHNAFVQQSFDNYLDSQKEALYRDVGDKLMNHPWLGGYWEGDAHHSIIDKIMEKPQMAFPLMDRLMHLHLTGQWNEKQFQIITEELIEKRWVEQLLGKELIQELLKMEIIKRLMEEARQDSNMMYQLVSDELSENSKKILNMENDVNRTQTLFSFEENRSPMRLMSPISFFNIFSSKSIRSFFTHSSEKRRIAYERYGNVGKIIKGTGITIGIIAASPILAFFLWFVISLIGIIWVGSMCLFTNDNMKICSYGFDTMLIGRWGWR